ncbi:aldehyde dehydrogenase family protein [Gordonia sp. PP30]|uniref:aldehyde dehydrogenase family protein n=1 Tax=Gordonia sp. PP30 TaxID=2935861 RepID=UPI0020001DBE|nr:aldehyde dehydrogenase family protein [Gordonia sp. PP30]UQE74943.1 aldehyde dehydrogenase family protein [Gordonia sp. PP30]
MNPLNTAVSTDLDLVLDRARAAARRFRDFDRAQVDRIVRAVAEAGFRHSRQLAEKAAAETGFGVAEDKVIKNEALSAGFVREYGDLDLVGHRIDAARKLLMVPSPAGVVLAVTPSTSPVANLYFKVLSCLLTRNAVVISPHPAAVATSIEAAGLLSDAAVAAGAPDGAIQILAEPSVPLIEAAMGDARVDLILATGGGAVVRAAYRSGTPAIGVGPGNAPVVVDETADLPAAAAAIVASKSYDNSVLCTAESVLIVVEAVADRLLTDLQSDGAHLCSDDEVRRLRNHLYLGGKLNTSLVGRPATVIAQGAGISVRPGTKVLLAPFTDRSDDESFTHEKLSPVLGVLRAADFADAVDAAQALVENVGTGHSAVIHSNDPQRVLDFTSRLPVHRIVVNAGGSLGNAGFDTGLAMTMSIGTGFLGGSSLGENLSPEHLVQWKRTAYETAAPFPRFDGLRVSPARAAGHGSLPGDDALREELRRLIAEELRDLFSERR